MRMNKKAQEDGSGTVGFLVKVIGVLAATVAILFIILKLAGVL